MVRGECRSLWDIEGAKAFNDRHRNNPVHCGTEPHPNWLPKDRRRGQSWRFDAVRFFKQCVIPEHVSRDLSDGDILVWLDADVVTFADVPASMVPKLLRGSDLCFLGRNKGAEIGFWAVTLNDRSRAFLKELSALYLEDRIFGLNQFHSAFAFDHVRQQQQRNGLGARNLTPAGRDHVWMQCRPLMEVCDHLKGDRKNYGYSPEHPLRWWERRV